MKKPASVSPLRAARALLVGMLLLLPAACQKTLFSDADPSTDWRLKRYYNNDSARAGTEDMKRASDMGFGIPGGFGDR